MDEDVARLVSEAAAHQLAVHRAAARQRCAPLLDTALTMQQLRAVLLVALDGPLTGHDLADRLGVSTATTSGLVDRLVERGAVERTDDPGDRRVRRVRLTGAGARVVRELTEAGREASDRVLLQLDVEDLRALVRGLAAVRAVVEREAAAAADRDRGVPLGAGRG